MWAGQAMGMDEVWAGHGMWELGNLGGKRGFLPACNSARGIAAMYVVFVIASGESVMNGWVA